MGGKLRDIKGIVEVSDYSLYYLIALIVLIVLIIVGITYLLSRPKKRLKPTSREMALKNLKKIDFKNPKEIAYGFTLNIPFFTNDENKDKTEELLEKLEAYKYKKKIPQMDEKLKNDIKKMIGRLK